MNKILSRFRTRKMILCAESKLVSFYVRDEFCPITLICYRQVIYLFLLSGLVCRAKGEGNLTSGSMCGSHTSPAKTEPCNALSLDQHQTCYLFLPCVGKCGNLYFSPKYFASCLSLRQGCIPSLESILCSTNRKLLYCFKQLCGWVF